MKEFFVKHPLVALLMVSTVCSTVITVVRLVTKQPIVIKSKEA